MKLAADGRSMPIDPPTVRDLQRFNALFRIAENGCWEWQGFCMRLGYGQFGHRSEGRRRMVYAHRASYTWLVEEIADGLTIDHLCRNPGCVNPSHLEVVSNQENIARAAALITHCKHGHPFTAENTYRTSTGKRDCRACNARRQRELRQRRKADHVCL